MTTEAPIRQEIRKTFLPLCVPEIRGNEWNYVKECLDTGWVSSVGKFVEQFEQAMASYVGITHGVATMNGTSALHIAMKVAGVEAGDEVVTSTMTFIAPANAIRYLGAFPVFIDAEPTYCEMDVDKAVEFLEKGCEWRQNALFNRATGRRVKAVLPVHILGHPVDLDPLLAAARKFGLPVIEDATESLGASYRGGMVGNLGDIACFSFNGNKLITTGGGGMIVTNRVEWAKRAKYLTTQAKDDGVEYVHQEVGYNYRLTNLAAAMGCAQMEVLPEYVETKRRIARTYASELRRAPGIAPMQEADWAHSAFWMYTVMVDAQKFGMDSRALLRKLDAAKIQTRPLWQPMHRSPAFADCGTFECPVAERLHANALSLPCSVSVTDADVRDVVDAMLQ